MYNVYCMNGLRGRKVWCYNSILMSYSLQTLHLASLVMDKEGRGGGGGGGEGVP